MFTVKEIISGDQIEVTPGWLWEGHTGTKVVVLGYSTPRPNMPGYEFAKKKLEALILNKEIELKNPRFYPELFGEKLVCRVYLNRVDIANFFPEFKSSSSV